MTDDEILRQFENCTLPFDQWTHRAHVKVAYVYLTRHPFEDALIHVRAGFVAAAKDHRTRGITWNRESA